MLGECQSWRPPLMAWKRHYLLRIWLCAMVIRMVPERSRTRQFSNQHLASTGVPWRPIWSANYARFALQDMARRPVTEDLRFTTDAALIDRLGRELVGKQETALTELVKNAYDADAIEVKVTFDGNK